MCELQTLQLLQLSDGFDPIQFKGINRELDTGTPKETMYTLHTINCMEMSRRNDSQRFALYETHQ